MSKIVNIFIKKRQVSVFGINKYNKIVVPFLYVSLAPYHLPA